MEHAIGIDVGGPKKGFHIAGVLVGSGKIDFLEHAQTPNNAVELLEQLGRVVCVAIDAPPRAQIQGPETRLSERQICKMGFRIQWTRRPNLPAPEWMFNGQNLWDALREAFPSTSLIETFPTLVTRDLGDSDLCLPLKLLGKFGARREWKDFVDATICAEVAARFLVDRAKFVGTDFQTGELDELGKIYY